MELFQYLKKTKIMPTSIIFSIDRPGVDNKIGYLPIDGVHHFSSAIGNFYPCCVAAYGPLHLEQQGLKGGRLLLGALRKLLLKDNM